MKSNVILALGLAAQLVAGSTVADEFADQALGLCEKVKACAMSEMNQQALTPQMREMMQPMLNNMCTVMSSNVQEVPKDHELYQPALACLKSLQALDCAAYKNMDEAGTRECEAYEAKLEQYDDGQ